MLACWDQGDAGTLISALRRFILLSVSMGVQIPSSSLHFKALWRLHKSWLLSVVPSEFRTPVHIGLALSVATLAFLYDRESLV